MVAFTKVVAQTTGRNFEFFHTTAQQQAQGYKNGEYNPKTNTIYIDINAGIDETAGVLQDQVLPTISHELVHIFAVEDPSGYEALADLVFAGLKESTGKTRASLVRAKMDSIEKTSPDRFKGKSEETRRAIAEEEIVARACEDRLANSRLMKEFVSEMENTESGLALKFSNFLGEAIDRLKKLFQQIFSTLSRSKEAQSLRKLTDRLEAIQTQFDALLERRNTANAAETTSDQQKNTSDRGVMLMGRKESESIKNQIVAAKEAINKMKPVVSIKSDGFKGKTKDQIATIIDETFKKFGSRVDRQNFGIVLLERNQINKALNYLIDPGEKAALLAVPKVIKKGIVVDEHLKHKARSVDSITFAAPVEINDVRGNVGVVVQRVSGTNRFKTLRILLPNGKAFEFAEEKEADSTTGGSPKESTSGGTPIESASADSISDFVKSVNPQISPTDKGSMSADRSTYMTARELLLQAMEDEELKKSEVYSPLLREYANRVKELDKKYMQLEVAEHEYVASIDAFDSAKTQESYKSRVDQLTREINRIERDLSAQEENKELKDIVKREKAATRKQTLQEARADTSQRMSDYRKTVERKSVMEQIDVKARRLSKKLSENTRKSHIPDDLKQPLQQFLAAIESKSANSQTVGNLNFKAAEPVAKDAQTNWVRDAKNSLKDLREAIEANSQVPIAKLSDKDLETQGGQYSGLLFIDPQILEEMDALAKYLEAINDSGAAFVLSEMDLDRLKQLNRTLAHVSKSVNSIDKAFAGQGKETISGLGASSMGYMLPMVERESAKKRSKLENSNGKTKAKAKKPDFIRLFCFLAIGYWL